jgi:hypothetical protein
MIRTKYLLGWASNYSLGLALFLGSCIAVQGQNSKQIVRQAVKTELAANSSDHSRWLYFEVDRKPKNSVTQWVAETPQGDLHRVLKQNDQQFPVDQQRKKMDSFVRDSSGQVQQRKAGQHDDQQATELLKLLPDAFEWTTTGSHDGNILLHFKPDPKFHAPNREARVFASMEGDMTVNEAQHRIVSLKGRLIRDVKFGGGLFATLKAGGTFDVERREVGEKLWQITETHVHIEGHALFFKSISEQEDSVKSKFKKLPDHLSFQEAEKELLKQNE